MRRRPSERARRASGFETRSVAAGVVERSFACRRALAIRARSAPQEERDCAMNLELSPSRASVLPLRERREHGADRALGRLVSLNGTEGVIACRMAPNEGGEHWSVGHLITDRAPEVAARRRGLRVVDGRSPLERKRRQHRLRQDRTERRDRRRRVRARRCSSAAFVPIPRSAPSRTASAPTISRRSTAFAAFKASKSAA